MWLTKKQGEIFCFFLFLEEIKILNFYIAFIAHIALYTTG